MRTQVERLREMILSILGALILISNLILNQIRDMLSLGCKENVYELTWDCSNFSNELISSTLEG
jgi:hypothetical protein